MNLPGRKRSLMRDINVVPYIDVMLVLLVIFMTTVPLLDQSVAIQLPQGETDPLPPGSTDPFVLSVDAEGRYYLDGNELTDTQLLDEVIQTLSSGPRRFQIRGDAEARYQFVIDAIVLLKQGGVENIDLISQSHQ